jgi:hypothetical protein
MLSSDGVLGPDVAVQEYRIALCLAILPLAPGSPLRYGHQIPPGWALA